MIRPLLRLAVFGACALALTGCSISLLPKGKPAQLYRFGIPAAAAPATPKPNAHRGVSHQSAASRRNRATTAS